MMDTMPPRYTFFPSIYKLLSHSTFFSSLLPNVIQSHSKSYRILLLCFMQFYISSAKSDLPITQLIPSPVAIMLFFCFVLFLCIIFSVAAISHIHTHTHQTFTRSIILILFFHASASCTQIFIILLLILFFTIHFYSNSF